MPLRQRPKIQALLRTLSAIRDYTYSTITNQPTSEQIAMAVQQFKPRQLISEQEYLDGELQSDIKHEYIAGEVYAMTGASANHSRIVTATASLLANHLANTPCEVFSSDMKVKAGQNFFYPDITVDCQNLAGDADFTDAPLIIVEVLSKTTRKIDHTLKRLSYQNLASLEEYVLIEQDFVDVEVCRRGNHWQSEHYFLGDEIYLSAIELRLRVESLYERVDNEEMRAFFNPQANGQNV